MADDQLTDMSSEFARLASFGGNTADVAAVMSTSSTPGCWNLRYNSPAQWAKAGFYCVPGTNGNVLRCSECSVEWRNAAGEPPMAVHRALNPNCPYLKSATPLSVSSPLIIPKTNINNVRRCLFLQDNENTSFTTENNNYLYKFQDYQQIKQKIFTPIGGGDFLFESRRILTFDNMTDHGEDFLKASEWAANGFIFQQPNMVQCVFCGLGLLFATDLSTCKMQHEQGAPHCPFVLKDNVGNVTLEMESAVNWKKEQPSPMDISLVFVHPQFEDDDKRLDTFREWSPQMYQRPEVLCQAGFYYTGCADKVVCFCCGVGLKKWQGQADPWTQHARLSPRCAYIQRVKGNNFVQDAQQAEVQADFDPPKSFQEGPVSSNGTVTTTNPIRPGLDLNVIKAALECQYTMAQIRQAILKIQSRYCGFPNFPLLIGQLQADDASRKMLLDLLRERQEKQQLGENMERERQEKERERQEKLQFEENMERERQEKEREKLRGQLLEEEKERERQEKERERQEKERERQERLQLEQAQQQMYADVLRLALERQTWQTRLREEEERRRQEEERRRRQETELSRQEEELQRLRAEIIRLRQGQAAQNEVDNPVAFAADPQVVAADPQEAASNPQGVAANPQGVAANPQGAAANPQGVAANPQGIVANPQGIAANPQGVAANLPLPLANLAPQCIMCLQEPATALFLPCSHLCCGVQCAEHFLRNPCPMCRQVVQERRLVFVA